MSFKTPFLTLISLVFAAFPAPVMAWGCAGHQIVAYIAERELNPVALSAVNSLLTSFKIDIHRNCTKPAGTTPMSDAATWADDVRFGRPTTAPWHFVDVPLKSAGADPTPFCNDNCVIKAITDQTEILRDPSPDDSEAKVEALRFIIHFMGDIHQPLHAITNADRGGNCVPVFFNKSKPHGSGSSFSPELHGIWDTQMVAELETRSDVSDPVGLAQLLFGEITAAERTKWKTGSPTDWAIESSNVAASAGYKGLTNSNGNDVSPASIAGSEVNNKCDATKEKAIVQMSLTANADYRDSAEAAIEEQLKRAGMRLANLLNEIWPDDSVTTAHHAMKHTHQ